jgi:hypothetical protein
VFADSTTNMCATWLLPTGSGVWHRWGGAAMSCSQRPSPLRSGGEGVTRASDLYTPWLVSRENRGSHMLHCLCMKQPPPAANTAPMRQGCSPHVMVGSALRSLHSRWAAQANPVHYLQLSWAPATRQVVQGGCNNGTITWLKLVTHIAPTAPSCNLLLLVTHPMPRCSELLLESVYRFSLDVCTCQTAGLLEGAGSCGNAALTTAATCTVRCRPN